MINTNYAYCEFSENYEIYAYYHQRYGHGLWYDTTTTTYDQALEQCKKVIRDKVQKDHPHLNLDRVIQTPDVPVFKDVIPFAKKEDEPKPTLSEEEQIIEAIKSASSIKFLKIWEQKAHYNPVIAKHYQEREFQLLYNQ